MSETDALSVEDEINSDVSETISGGIVTIKADNTYSSLNNEGDAEDGTWAISNDGKTLTFDAGTSYEDKIVIVSLTSSSMVVKIPAETEEVDIDEDQVDETTLTLNIELGLTKN